MTLGMRTFVAFPVKLPLIAELIKYLSGSFDWFDSTPTPGQAKHLGKFAPVLHVFHSGLVHSILFGNMT